MEKVFRYFRSSIGTKQCMGIAGLLLCAFVIVHLGGNLLLFAGPDTFNGYAHALESKMVLLIPVELVLLGIFLVHMLAALKQALKNWSARGWQRYQGPKPIEPKYWPSSLMGYTGILILIFLIIHLLDFKFAPKHGGQGELRLYQLVVSHFSQLSHVLLYVFFMAVLGVHLFHGFQSAFLTLGLDHPKFTPWIRRIGYVYAILMALGFTVIPLYAYIYGGGIS